MLFYTQNRYSNNMQEVLYLATFAWSHVIHTFIDWKEVQLICTSTAILASLGSNSSLQMQIALKLIDLPKLEKSKCPKHDSKLAFALKTYIKFL